jgi:hypothetical protein
MRNTTFADIRRGFAPRTLCLALAAALLAALIPIADVLRGDEQQSEQTWTGTWSNRKYKTTGPLKCVARQKDDKTWEATFSGTFMRDPFEYSITFSADQQRDRTLIGGSAMLDGDGYEWTGHIRGRTMYGQFRSLKGHNGEFTLQASR